MRTVLAIMLGVVLSLAAQASSLVGSVSGRTVDAAGRAVANQRVELVGGGQVLNVATTNSQGAWAFANVAAGDYTVRTSVNGTVAGIRVTVTEGAAVTASAIVVPAAAVAPQFGALAGLVSSAALASGTAAASVVQALAIDTEVTNLNAEQVAAIFNALEPADQVAFAQAVIARSDAGTGSGTTTNGGNVFKPVSVGSVSSDGASAAVFDVLQKITVLADSGSLQPNDKISIAVTTNTTTGTTTVGATTTLVGFPDSRVTITSPVTVSSLS